MKNQFVSLLLAVFFCTSSVQAQNVTTSQNVDRKPLRTEMNVSSIEEVFPDKHLIKVGEYLVFLNAVANRRGVHGLYNNAMGSQILQISEGDELHYSTIDDSDQEILLGLTELNAMRYCNWVESGSLFENDDQTAAVDSTKYGSCALTTTTVDHSSSNSPLMMFRGDRKTPDSEQTDPYNTGSRLVEAHQDPDNLLRTSFIGQPEDAPGVVQQQPFDHDVQPQQQLAQVLVQNRDIPSYVQKSVSAVVGSLVIYFAACYSEVYISSYNSQVIVPETSHSFDQIKNERAFAVILNSGGICCWGDPRYGGTAPTIPIHRIVVSIASTGNAFTAILDDGSLLSWGDPRYGGTTPTIPAGRKVVSIASTVHEFMAILNDGSFLSWGSFSSIETTPTVPRGRRVVAIASTNNVFTAILDDGSLLSWGAGSGMPPAIPNGRRVVSVASTRNDAFTVILDDGSILCWGRPESGGITPKIPEGRRVVSIASTINAFTAILDDGSLISWGSAEFGGTTPEIPDGKKVKSVFSTSSAFTAVLDDGSPLSWGPIEFGGATPTIPNGEKVKSITSTDSAFTAILNDGSLISWGSAGFGGTTPKIPDRKKVKSVFSTSSAFTAVLDDGSLFSWGDPESGGITPGLPAHY